MMDNDFKSESKVTPFAKADTLAQRFGNGRTNTFTLKIPLTESSIGYFDIDEVLGNDSLDRDQQSFLSRMANGFKMAIYNIALRMGIRNKFKINTANYGVAGSGPLLSLAVLKEYANYYKPDFVFYFF